MDKPTEVTESRLKSMELHETVRPRPDTNRLCEFKTTLIEQQGYNKTGYVLTNDDGRICISDKGAVRWLDADEFWPIMHPDTDYGKIND